MIVIMFDLAKLFCNINPIVAILYRAYILELQLHYAVGVTAISCRSYFIAFTFLEFHRIV